MSDFIVCTYTKETIGRHSNGTHRHLRRFLKKLTVSKMPVRKECCPWMRNASKEVTCHWRTCLPSIVHTLKRNEEQVIFWVKAKEETEKGVTQNKSVHIKRKTGAPHKETRRIFLSLLSDSNQRPRDYKSRALAN